VDVSVRALKRETKNVVVLTDHVGNVDEYGSMVEDLGVNQTPAVVVIDSRGSARLIEGYVDSKSLVQVVADAR
jgi:thioredoxin-related protein